MLSDVRLFDHHRVIVSHGVIQTILSQYYCWWYGVTISCKHSVLHTMQCIVYLAVSKPHFVWRAPRSRFSALKNEETGSVASGSNTNFLLKKNSKISL